MPTCTDLSRATMHALSLAIETFHYGCQSILKPIPWPWPGELQSRPIHTKTPKFKHQSIQKIEWKLTDKVDGRYQLFYLSAAIFNAVSDEDKLMHTDLVLWGTSWGRRQDSHRADVVRAVRTADVSASDRCQCTVLGRRLRQISELQSRYDRVAGTVHLPTHCSRYTERVSQMTQMNPRDALLHAHCAVHKGGRSVW